MLINNDIEVRQYLPNAIATCDGEASLYDKLQHHLLFTERWLADNVVGHELLTAISGAVEDERRALCCQIVVLYAFYRALPSLDLVLTPNGFGIVNNGNLAPASSDRVKTLAESLIANRDENIQQLLLLLAKDSGWRSSEQGHWFAATLFPTLELAEYAGFRTDVWRNYKTLREQVISIEDELAEKYISKEVYAKLREHFQSRSVTEAERPIIRLLRQTELELVTGKALNYERVISLVQRIREDGEHFPEWKTSSTAMLFCRPAFHNEKHSGGYWW